MQFKIERLRCARAYREGYLTPRKAECLVKQRPIRMKTFVHSDIAAHTRSTMARYVYALTVTIWLAAAGLAHAGITDAVKFATLPNGLQVLLLENHKAPVATFNVFYKVGSRNEQFGKTGISHLCEHLMFHGTK